MPFSIQVALFKALMAILKLITLLLPAPKPTIYSGENSAKTLCGNMQHFGVKKVLVVTDEMLVKLGVVGGITKHLDDLGIDHFNFAEVLPDPSYEVVEKGERVCRENHCDAILAIGGGSPLDAAKIIAAKMTNDKTVKQLTGILKVSKPCLPLFVIPTTAGTGSETTIAGVVSDPETNQKTPVIDPKLVPIAAALDPTLMSGLPPHITAATGMDALTHAVESYVSRHASAETDNYARAAVKMIMKNLPIAYEDGKNLDAREAMAMASFYAGAAFTKANLGYVHAIAHQYGALYHTPHGLANAIVLPYIMEYSMLAAKDRLAELAVEIGVGTKDEAPERLAQKFVTALKELNQKIGIPTQLDSLQESDIDRVAQGALKEAHYLYPVPKYMDMAQCRTIVRKMLPN